MGLGNCLEELSWRFLTSQILHNIDTMVQEWLKIWGRRIIPADPGSCQGLTKVLPLLTAACRFGGGGMHGSIVPRKKCRHEIKESM
jgi:hypothetical protein